MPSLRVVVAALILPVLGCGGGGSKNADPLVLRLRSSIGIDLSQVSTLVALSPTGSSTKALRASGARAAGAAPQAEGGTPQLLALTLSGEVLEVSLVEPANPQGPVGVVAEPPVQAIFPTPSWILFSTPGFEVSVRAGDAANPSYVATPCSLIAARRSDGALFCAPMWSNSRWEGNGVSDTILANGAGDVIYTMASYAGSTGGAQQIGPSRLYRIMLGGTEGPMAMEALETPVAALRTFRVNGAGDLFVSYIASTMDPVMRSLVVPIDGSSATVVQGAHNDYVIAGEPGQADEDTFYVRGGGGVDEATVRVVAKAGSSFTEQTYTLNVADAWSYQGLSRLSDGVYMFSSGSKKLARVIADGAVIVDPTPTMLSGVDRIVGGGIDRVASQTGQWVFIAASGAGYEFVRHDGVSQQDVPFDVNLDISSFTVAPNGAIDFLATRIDTQEKIHGSVAAGATEVTTVAAGMLDPAHVIAFTRID